MKVAISLTVHERLDVLADQVRNIMTFFVDPMVIVHINSDFYRTLIEDQDSLRLLKEITAKSPMIINPEHLPTRWAHMFHAHISNVKLLSRFYISYEYLVLLSSSDIMIRHGVESFLKNFDYGIDPAKSDLNGDFWIDRVRNDRLFLELRRKNNAGSIVKSLHEGTFYSRHLMMDLLARLEEAIPDWEYDDKYPKEEFFLPSLASANEQLSYGGSISYALGFDAALDRVIIATFIRDHALDRQFLNPLLSAWVEESLDIHPTPSDALASKFSISRIVRDSGHPLRLLLLDGSQPLYRKRTEYIVRRLSLEDLLMIDYPSRLSYSTSSRSPLLERKIRASPVENIRWSAMDFAGCEPVDVALPACPGDFAVPVPIWAADASRDAVMGQVEVCAMNLPYQLEARICLADSRLLLERSDEGTASIASDDSLLFMFFLLRQGPPIAARGIVVKSMLEADVSATAAVPKAVWMEFHSDDGKKKFSMGRDDRSQAGSISRWHLDDDDRERILDSRAKAGSFFVYLGYDLTEPMISLAEVGFI